MTSLEVLNAVKNVNNDWGKGDKKHKKKNIDATQPWKKKSNETYSFCGGEGHPEYKCYKKLEH